MGECRSSLGPGNNMVLIFLDDGRLYSGEADEIAIEHTSDGEYWLSITLGDGRIEVRISDASLAERLAKALEG
ncbi:MAG: hypothetical protein GSR84_05330 [Desulfurococcales archaeon]|nr:hypothetical protein [Desulfurococcales archaeon]